jgi:hypothetical protein
MSKKEQKVQIERTTSLDCPDITPDRWLLFITHEYLPNEIRCVSIHKRHTYQYIYRVIARLLYTHSLWLFKTKTEDISPTQISFLLEKLILAEPVNFKSLDCRGNSERKEIDLFWNWEEGVNKFASDEYATSIGEESYFHKDVIFSDYHVEGIEDALDDMDKLEIK